MAHPNARSYYNLVYSPSPQYLLRYVSKAVKIPVTLRIIGRINIINFILYAAKYFVCPRALSNIIITFGKKC